VEPGGSDRPIGDPRPEIIAHRGFSARAPENTIAALRMALDAGADAVEWDVQVARCGTPVLFHDEVLDRTTDGSGPLRALTAVDLTTLDAGSWFSPHFAGERVPTLRAALNAVGARAKRIYSEIKGQPQPRAVDRMLEEVQSAGLAQRTIFISMDWQALDQIRAMSREQSVGYIVEKRTRFEQAIAHVGSDRRALLDVDYRIVLGMPQSTERALALGKELAVWTVNRVEDAEALWARGVTRITTNEVVALREWADRLAPGS
jgi:glycerophosphoryl diester phosphodiesterase